MSCQAALDGIRLAASPSVGDSDGVHSTVDLSLEEDGGATLHLVINIGKMWHPEICLPLLPLDVDKYDMILAHYRDTKEEMELLQAELHRLKSDNGILRAKIQRLVTSRVSTVYVRLNHANDVAGAQMIPWSGECKQAWPNKYFSKSNDHTTITVLKKGIYQITVRLLATVGSKQAVTSSILINGAEVVSSAYHSLTAAHSYGHAITLTCQVPVQMTETLKLMKGSKISVKAGELGCHGSQSYGRASNSLTILLLEEQDERERLSNVDYHILR